MTGLPGRYFDRYGWKKRNVRDVPPPSLNGMMIVTVSPSKFTSAFAALAESDNTPATTTPDKVISVFLSIFLSIFYSSFLAADVLGSRVFLCRIEATAL